MNFLAHLALSGDDPEIMVGNFMGDFVKGNLAGRFPPRIGRGVMLHRQIDTFALHNADFRCSKRRLDASFGHYRGVLVDVFYDHFLARNWDEYSAVPFAGFLAHARGIIEGYEGVVPERLAGIIPVIFSELIPSYRDVTGIERALERMAARVARPNPLGRGSEELRVHYGSLRDDFARFFPTAVDFVRSAGDVIDR
jgi:acyl carrier protein phosphodiesterase